MTDSEQSGNFYARELVQILAEHGLELADLVDRVGLDPSTVQRPAYRVFQMDDALPLTELDAEVPCVSDRVSAMSDDQKAS